MTFAAMLRVRNESCWIERVVQSLLPLCQSVHVMDDHSTDNTVEIIESFRRAVVYRSPFEGLDETRDKTWLLRQILQHETPDYIVAIDGDEELEPKGHHKIRDAIRAYQQPDALMLRVIYLWNNRDTWRSDGVYGRFYRPSVFRVIAGKTEYRSTNANGNLHCTNVPYALINRAVPCEARLLHYGYIHSEIRQRKIEYYRSVDPNNEFEDNYRHITQGDPGGEKSIAKLRHAGPLKLDRLVL